MGRGGGHEGGGEGREGNQGTAALKLYAHLEPALRMWAMYQAFLATSAGERSLDPPPSLPPPTNNDVPAPH